MGSVLVADEVFYRNY